MSAEKKLNNNVVEVEEMEKNSAVETLEDIIFEDFKKMLEDDNFLDEDFKEIREESAKQDLEQAVYDYHTGQEAAFDFIYEHYRPRLERLAYRRNDEDLAQELSEVLWTAVKRFKLSAGVKFNTFFWTCAQNHIGTQNIRRNAQKRSGAKKMMVNQINPETGEMEQVEEIIKTKVVSMQATIKSKDSETEVGNFIENQGAKNQYNDSNLNLALERLYELKVIKEKEKQALELIMRGDTLAEIGEKLGGITAPAVHVMLRRLGQRKNVGPYLKEILSYQG
jgi:RNA polymerase sigma factor (sigma-70 family)